MIKIAIITLNPANGYSFSESRKSSMQIQLFVISLRNHIPLLQNNRGKPMLTRYNNF